MGSWNGDLYEMSVFRNFNQFTPAGKSTAWIEGNMPP
jgi:hypothetical protein